VTTALQAKLILWAHENEASSAVDFQLFRQQTLAMQMDYDNVVSPANIAKIILDEFKDFNPFKLLKYSFWYCSPVFFFFDRMLNHAKTTPWIKGTGFIANI
jgi:hypothetical protein